MQIILSHPSRSFMVFVFIAAGIFTECVYSQAYTLKQRYIDIEYNKPLVNPDQQIVASLDTPAWLVDEYLAVQKDLNQVIGGYNRYVMIFWNPEGEVADQKPVFDKLQELKFSGYEDGYTIEELLQVQGCLTGSDASGKYGSLLSDPYSICIQPITSIRYKNWDMKQHHNETKYWSTVYNGWAHEYFHRYQRSHPMDQELYKYSPNGNGNVGAPFWWVEGAAALFPNLWFKANYQNFERFKGLSWDQVECCQTDMVNLYNEICGFTSAAPKNHWTGIDWKAWEFGLADENYETIKGWPLQILVNSYIAYRSSYDALWVKMPEDFYELGFEGALIKNTGMDLKTLYQDFTQHMKTSCDIDGPPEGMFIEGKINSYVSFKLP